MRLIKVAFLLSLFFYSNSSFATSGWSLNLGYNNPPGSTVGGNFMYEWSQWAFEIGVGSVKTSSTDSNGNKTDQASIGGDLDFKYLMGSGGFRPYFQVGTGYGVSTSIGIGGSAYGGIGFFGMGSSWYGYGSYNISSSGGTGFFQIGIGLDL